VTLSGGERAQCLNERALTVVMRAHLTRKRERAVDIEEDELLQWSVCEGGGDHLCGGGCGVRNVSTSDAQCIADALKDSQGRARVRRFPRLDRLSHHRLGRFRCFDSLIQESSSVSSYKRSREDVLYGTHPPHALRSSPLHLLLNAMPVPTTSQAFYVHSLPHELLASLKPRKGHAMLAVEDAQPEDSPIPAVQDDVATTSTGPGGRACNVCLDATFANVDEQRSHFRSDWHRYNLKVRLNGGQPVDEGRFAQLVEGASR
jgi:hypothetical protein